MHYACVAPLLPGKPQPCPCCSVHGGQGAPLPTCRANEPPVTVPFRVPSIAYPSEGRWDLGCEGLASAWSAADFERVPCRRHWVQVPLGVAPGRCGGMDFVGEEAGGSRALGSERPSLLLDIEVLMVVRR